MMIILSNDKVSFILFDGYDAMQYDVVSQLELSLPSFSIFTYANLI